MRLGVDIDLGGHPDLQGVWDFRTATPLERPPEFAQREFLSDEDVAAVERRAAERLRVDGTGDQLCIGVAIVALSSCTDSRPWQEYETGSLRAARQRRGCRSPRARPLRVDVCRILRCDPIETLTDAVPSRFNRPPEAADQCHIAAVRP